MWKNGEKGFVLVPAMWLAGLIAVALSAFLVNIKIDVRAAANLVENAKAEFLADGVVRLAAYELSVTTDMPSAGDGQPMRCSVGGDHEVIVSVQDQAGLVDLNAASPATLEAAGELLGLTAEAARANADRIIDLRDSDDDARPSGGEAREYQAAGLDLPPKNAPFQDVAELDQVLGMSEELRGLLSPVMTVHSQQDGIDGSVAPLTLRESKELRRLPPSVSQRKAFAIEAIVSSAGGGSFHRRAVVGLLRRSERPFAVMEWNRGTAKAAAELQSTHPGKCVFELLKRSDETRH